MWKTLKYFYNMGFYRIHRKGGFYFPLFRKYPDFLKGSWIQWTISNDIYGPRAIECVYTDNRHPSGTLIFSEFIDNTYPTVYANIDIRHYDNEKEMHMAQIDRLYCNPLYRKNKLGSTLAIFGYTVFPVYYNICVQQGKTTTKIADKMQVDAANSILKLGGKFNTSRKTKKDLVMGSSIEYSLPSEHDVRVNPLAPAVWHDFSVREK